MRPSWSLCCVDTVAKKASFVRQVAAELALRNLRAEHARVEQLQLPTFDVVVSRAFASLADFTRLTRQQLAPGGCWLAMKGIRPDGELKALPADIMVEAIIPLAVPGLGAERHLIILKAGS